MKGGVSVKPEWNKKYTTICVYIFITAAAIILFASAIIFHDNIFKIIRSVFSLLSPVIYGVAIAYLLSPLDRMINSFLRRLLSKSGKNLTKLCNILSIVLSYVIFLAVIAGFAFLMVPDIAASLKNIKDSLPTYYNTVVAYVDNLDIPFLEIPENAMEIDSLLKNAYSIISGLFPQIYTFFQSLITEVMNFLIGVLISIYVLAGRGKVKKGCKKFLHAMLSDDKVEKVTSYCSEIDRTFGGFISGKILDSIIIGIICFISMTILRMPNTALISVIVGVTNVIPFFGPFIGAIPSAIIILLVEPSKTIWFIILIIAIQQLDGNVIGPKILGGTTGLPAFWVIFSLLLFGGFLGVFGMIIAVPVFAMIYNGIKRFTDKRLERKNKKNATDKHW